MRIIFITFLIILFSPVSSIAKENIAYLLIVKSQYKLSLVNKEEKIIKSYPVVFGFEPVKDKRQEGDGATPEGIFRVRAKYPHKDWSKFIWIDYPTQESWTKFNKAKKEGLISNNASIGGEIGIHGVPKDMDYLIKEKQNWTLGCISLTNKDINDLYKYVSAGMVIKIIP